MEAFVIVGEAHSLKSSVIRSLTGCRIRGPRKFSLLNKRVISAYVQLSSLQESAAGTRESPGVSPADFAARVSKSKADATIFPLRIHALGAHPDADSYLKYFVQVAGWNIVSIAVLNVAANPLKISIAAGILTTYQFSGAACINDLASQVRCQFCWV